MRKETHKSHHDRLFQMVPLGADAKIRGNVFSRGRLLVGRTESCDFVIPSEVISAVHAVIEVGARETKVYDMNSKNGVFVNGEKVVASRINVGDSISFGNVTFTFKEYLSSTDLPPVLETLDPLKSEGEVTLPEVPQLESTQDTPSIVYPLSMDPKADNSEYIFEDASELYPIFKYEVNRQAVEIIILFKDKVFSVDYIPDKDGVYNMVGSQPNSKEIEFAYLGKKDKVPFVEIKNGLARLNLLPGYKTTCLGDKGFNEVNASYADLNENEILRLQNGELEIYARKVASPPKVKSAPLLGRDTTLKKYLALILFFVLLPVLGLSFFFEVDEEMKKEKNPERIATILYKQPLVVSKNKTIEKTEKAPPEKQKTVQKNVAENKPKKPTPAPKVSEQPKSQKEVPKDPGSKTAAKKQVVKKAQKPAPKAPSQVTKTASSAAQTPRASVKSATTTATKGAVDVYKSADFRSTVSSLVAKGGSLKGAKVSNTGSSSSVGSASISGGVATNLRKADVGTDVGSLTGAATGKLGQTKGAEGLSAKKGIAMAGIPSETVVLGSMDPDTIRRILRQHIPDFRYCYQKELDRNAQQAVSGTVGLRFTIGASGHVTSAGLSRESNLPSHVKSCVVRVLRGIQFPSPRGGGRVEVNQPFNFYPQNL